MATHYATHRLNEVASTQDEARARFLEGGAVLVLAERQLEGRGRSGNVWVHAPRACAASLAIRPGWPEPTVGVIPLLAGMAARTVVEEEFGTLLSLKWPNDLMRGEAKAGGVLVEMTDGVMVAGCGINVWWPDAPATMAAVSSEDPGPALTSALAESWGAALVEMIDAGPSAWSREAYVAACSTIGRQLEWDPDGVGTAVDLAPDGGLIVETPTGRAVLRSGEVRMVRPQ